jgi:hypothetical protein
MAWYLPTWTVDGRWLSTRRREKAFHAGFGHVGFCNSAPFLLCFFTIYRDFKTTHFPKRRRQLTSSWDTRFGRICTVHSRIVGGSDLGDLFSTPSDTNAGLGLLFLLPQPSLQEIPAKAKGLSYLSSQRAGDPRIRPGKTLAG